MNVMVNEHNEPVFLPGLFFRVLNFSPLLKGSGFLGYNKKPWGINGGGSALEALLKVGNPWGVHLVEKNMVIMQSARVVCLSYVTP